MTELPNRTSKGQAPGVGGTDQPPDHTGRQTRWLRGLGPNVVRLGLVSFFADVSSEMVYPLIPIFLTATLHAPVAVVGLIEGCAEAVASVLKSVSGALSDRSRRRIPYIFSGYSMSAVAKPLMALAVGWPLVLVARVGDRFGKGLRTSPRDALIADSVVADQRGRAFGWHRAMDTMGAVVGPLVALALVWATNDNIRLILLLAFIPGLIGALLVLAVRDIAHTPVNAPAWLRWSAMPDGFRAYLVAWGVFALGNSSDVFLILRASQMGYGTPLVIGLYVLYNVVYALSSPSLGGLSDRIGRKRVMLGGLLVFALVYAGFALITSAWQLWILFAVYGLYVASTEGVGKALAVDLVPREVRGRALGVLGTLTGMATLIASAAAGLLWSAVGPSAAFAYGAAGALISALLFFTLGPLQGR